MHCGPFIKRCANAMKKKRLQSDRDTIRKRLSELGDQRRTRWWSHTTAESAASSLISDSRRQRFANGIRAYPPDAPSHVSASHLPLTYVLQASLVSVSCCLYTSLSLLHSRTALPPTRYSLAACLPGDLQAKAERHVTETRADARSRCQDRTNVTSWASPPRHRTRARNRRRRCAIRVQGTRSPALD
jgi:hypothetical protein